MQKNSRSLTTIEDERAEKTTKDILSQVDDSGSVGAKHKKQQKEIRKLEDSKTSNTKVDSNRESIRSSTRKR